MHLNTDIKHIARKFPSQFVKMFGKKLEFTPVSRTNVCFESWETQGNLLLFPYAVPANCTSTFAAYLLKTKIADLRANQKEG